MEVKPNSRRNFLKTSLFGISAGFICASAHEGHPIQPTVIKPKRLKKGMTIGLVAPASNAGENEDIRFAIDVISSLGFKVKTGNYLYERNFYLAGKDRERAEDVNNMFRDGSVDAIFCLRGGYGTPRMLPFLDYQAIQNNPKVLMGYSDITGLLHAITTKTGLITFHGPIARQNFSEYTLDQFKRVLMNPSSRTLIGEPPPFEAREGTAERENRITRFFPGKTRGALMGGNLSLLVKLMGTPFEPDFKDKILVLEDVNEEPYRIDGMLTHLWLAGRLQQLAGLVFAKFTDCDSKGGNSYSLEQIFEQRCQMLKIPALRGLMLGHVEDQTVMPVGGLAELDVEKGTLTLTEPAVL